MYQAEKQVDWRSNCSSPTEKLIRQPIDDATSRSDGQRPGRCLPLLAAQTDYARRIAPLIDPAKLATLGKLGPASLPSRQIESQPYESS